MHEIGLKTRKARKYRGFGQKEKYLDPVKSRYFLVLQRGLEPRKQNANYQ